MNPILAFLLVAIFSIFVGAQITEAALMLPHWKVLPATEFYEYYNQFGAGIGRFYSILTLMASAIPLGTSIYFFSKKSPARWYSLASLLLTLMFVAVFFIYFKDANQRFFDAGLSTEDLAAELVLWGYWHWFRVGLELLALSFLILALSSQAKEQV